MDHVSPSKKSSNKPRPVELELEENELTFGQIAAISIGAIITIGIAFTIINPSGIGWKIIVAGLIPVIWATRTGWLPHAPKAAGFLGFMLAGIFILFAGPVIALGLSIQLALTFLLSTIQSHAENQQRFRGWSEFDLQIRQVWSKNWRGQHIIDTSVSTRADQERLHEDAAFGCVFLLIAFPFSLALAALAWPFATIYGWIIATKEFVNMLRTDEDNAEQ